MKVVIYEYGAMSVSVISTLGFLAVVERLFLGETGFLALLISTVVGGN